MIKVHVAADGTKSFQVYGLYVRPSFDSTPHVKITKPKLIDLRSSLKADDEVLDVADKPLA